MADYRLDFRDLAQRIARAKAMSETVMLGGAGGRTNASTMILDNGDVQKPMLGRYQVEKELGKGPWASFTLGEIRRSTASWRSRRWPCLRSSTRTNWSRSRSASSVKRKPPVA